MQEAQPTRKLKSIVSEDIERWIFNRKQISFEVLLHTLASALSPQALVSNGGYLFKASLQSSVFHLGMIPTLRDGERGYHYTIRLKFEDAFTLIGNITPQRELSIIFNNPAVVEGDKPAYQRVYQRLAHVMLLASPDNPLTLDWITTHLLEQKQIFPSMPQTLMELASLP
ncbi:MAG: hypothetical protein CVV52_14545 [Spirochaetae bacterium HGW-Spirochaetae-8]|jgi:hypothetical protein|nr:MAG: hypothetical protein CVV52_14545 [Spirochaetae bacterium HGW-Spirochaetae-8]